MTPTLNDVSVACAALRRKANAKLIRSMRGLHAVHRWKGAVCSAADLADEAGIDRKAMAARLTRGWPVAQAVQTPLMTKAEAGTKGMQRRWA